MTDEKDPPEQLPKSLIDKLKSADEPMPLITARVDREVRQMAADAFAARKPSRWRRQAWLATAASLLVVVFLFQSQEMPVQHAPRHPDDIDGSGRVDIADVLALARTAEANGATQADIDALARRIVSVSAAGEST